MTFLLILNDPPYGTERSYNAMRLARALLAEDGTQVRLFLLGDSAACAMRGQKTPDGYYNLETMIRSITRSGASVGCCGTCMDARGITDEMLADGARRSSMKELAGWASWAEKVLTF